MHAVVINDEKLEMTERPTPDPGPYDVVVAVRAAGINAADLLQRQGYYPPPPGWPVDVPGMELADESAHSSAAAPKRLTVSCRAST
jgi:NADPH2:quinone reductase